MITTLATTLTALDRKFVLVVGASIVNVALLVRHYIDAASFVSLVTLTVGAYIAGHSAEKIFAKDGAPDANSTP